MGQIPASCQCPDPLARAASREAGNEEAGTSQASTPAGYPPPPPPVTRLTPEVTDTRTRAAEPSGRGASYPSYPSYPLPHLPRSPRHLKRRSGGNRRQNARHATHLPRRGAAPEATAAADGKRSVRSHNRQERTVRVHAGGNPPGGMTRPPPRTPSRGQVRSQGGLVTSHRRRKGIGPGRSAWIGGGQLGGIAQLLGQAGQVRGQS